MEPKCGKIVEPNCAVRGSVGTELGACVMIYTINRVLMCMWSEMAMDFRFTKWNRCWMIDCEQQSEGFTVHVNSVHKIFCAKMCLVE